MVEDFLVVAGCAVVVRNENGAGEVVLTKGLPVGREKRRIGTGVPDIFGLGVVMIAVSGRQVVAAISDVTEFSVEVVVDGRELIVSEILC